MPGLSGFPDRMDYTPVPSPFLGSLLKEMDDLAELKCALRTFWHLHRKRGNLRLVTLAELLGDPVITSALVGNQAPARESLRRLLARLEQRGVFRVVALREGEAGVLLDTPGNRQAVERLGKEVAEPASTSEAVSWPAEEERPNIFQLYEANIGLLTPLIAEELKEAEASYPTTWIREAFQEAVRYNRRSWRYITRILERWAQEGKDDGEPGRRPETIDAKEYIRRYGAPWRS